MCRYIYQGIYICKLKESGANDVFRERFTRGNDGEAGKCSSAQEKWLVQGKDYLRLQTLRWTKGPPRYKVSWW